MSTGQGDDCDVNGRGLGKRERRGGGGATVHRSREKHVQSSAAHAMHELRGVTRAGQGRTGWSEGAASAPLGTPALIAGGFNIVPLTVPSVPSFDWPSPSVHAAMKTTRTRTREDVINVILPISWEIREDMDGGVAVRSSSAAPKPSVAVTHHIVWPGCLVALPIPSILAHTTPPSYSGSHTFLQAWNITVGSESGRGSMTCRTDPARRKLATYILCNLICNLCRSTIGAFVQLKRILLNMPDMASRNRNCFNFGWAASTQYAVVLLTEAGIRNLNTHQEKGQCR